MASFINPDAPDQIYKWIEKKPLTEAVLWTPREKFYLIASVMSYGRDWNKAVRILKKKGEPYRPEEWYTLRSCERQFEIILNSQTNEVKSMKPCAMLKHMSKVALKEFEQYARRSLDSYVTKYSTINGVVKKAMQANLPENEVDSLYSQVHRTETEDKQYMEQLRTKQNACLALENLNSSKEPIKRNLSSANRNTIAIASQFQSPSGTSRTRSKKLLPLSPSVVKTTQGTPTLSKLLKAPPNPYKPSPSQSAQKIKQSKNIESNRQNGNNPKKENLRSPSLNRRQVGSLMTHGPFSQLNGSKLSNSKSNTSRSAFSAVENGSKATTSVINLLSDNENEEDKSLSQNIHPKNIFIFGEKKKIIGSPSRIEPTATRSQIRADGGFKHLNDYRQSDEKKEPNVLRQSDKKKDPDVLSQQIEGSQMNKGDSIDDDIIDIDQIEIEPLFTIQDEVTISSKVTQSSTQKLDVKTPADSLSINKTNSKEINNQMLEEISANFVLNSPIKNVADFKDLKVGQCRIENTNITGCLIPVDSSALNDSMMLQKDNQCFPSPNNTLIAYDGKLLRKKKLIELKSTNIKCFDGKNDKHILTLANQPIVVANIIKEPFHINLAPEVKNKTDITSLNSIIPIRYQSGSQNLVKLQDDHCSSSDEVIVIDDANINVNDGQRESSKSQLQIMSFNSTVDNDSSGILSVSKISSVQLDKKTNDKTLLNLSGKPQNMINTSSNKLVNQDALSKTETESSNLAETNNRFIEEIDFDFGKSTSIPDFYNGVEEIVEVHSFDDEDFDSLIESSSLDKSEEEKHQNTLDQGDFFVSECDSTIGAFDEFAQITRVAQKPVSKDIKSINREPKTIKQSINDLEHKNFVHVKEKEDSLSEAVTGIPVLLSIISDVMSKINSDCIPSLKKSEHFKTVPLNDINDISSVEEKTVCNEVTILDVVEQNKTQEYDEVNFKELNENKSQTINKSVKGLIDVNNKSETSKFISKNIANNISNEISSSDKINVRNITFNASKKCATNIGDEVKSVQCETEIKLNEDNLKINKSKSEQSSDYIKKKKKVGELKNEADSKSQFDCDNLKQIELVKNTKKTGESLSTEIAERKKQGEKQKEVMNMQVKETKTKEFEAEIMLRCKQNEERKAKAFEMIKLREAERRMKEVEAKKKKDAVIKKPKKCKINEDELFQKGKDKAFEMQQESDKEAKLQNAKKAENQNADEFCIQIVNEAKLLKSNNAPNIQRESEAKELKDTELKNFKEAETPISELGRIKKQADEIKECKSQMVILLKEKNVAVAELQKDQEVLTSEKQIEIIKKSERSTVDTKNVEDSTKEIESKMGKSKEQEQQKVAEIEENQNIDVQIITKTRESKVEDILRVSNLKSVVLRKPYVPLKSDVFLTNYNLKNENKCNPSALEFSCSSNINSRESLNEVSKSKTLCSSSFKQSKVEKTKSSSPNKSNDQSEPCTVSKASLETKTRISTFLDEDSQTTSSNLQRKLSSSDNGNMLRADAIPSLNEIDNQHTNNTLIKLSKVKFADNKHLPQTIVDNNAKLYKPGPKERGCKRRISTQYENCSKSNSDKRSLQNNAVAVMNTPSTSMIQPPAKKTKKSINSQDNNIMSLERTKKNIPEIFYDSKCKGYNFFLALEKQIKNVCPDYHAIIKDRSTPLELRNITEKIDSGEILELPDLQVKLFMMYMNTVMLNVNKSNPVEADVATNFILHELPRNCPVFPNTADKDDEPDQNKKELKKKNVDGSGDIDKQLEFSDIKSDDCNNVQSENDDDKVNDYVSTLSDCYSDEDSNRDLLILNHKETDSDSSSNYDEDNNNYNSKFF